MSLLLQEIVTAVNTEIIPSLPLMSSERKRIEMRVTLSALEKMIKHIRLELLDESKRLKNERKNKKMKGLINKNENNNPSTILAENEESV